MNISGRIRQIRKLTGLNQEDFAASIGLKRANYANIETGRQEPTIDTLTEIVTKYKDTVELATYQWILDGTENGSKMASNLATKVASNWESEPKEGSKAEGTTYIQLHTDTAINAVAEPEAEMEKLPVTMPRVITIDTNGEENVIYVPVKARAGYLTGYSDATFIGKLPAFRLPGFTNGTFRIFEVSGNSMFNTLHDHDKVIARWSMVSDMRDDRVYVVITKNDGILVKRVINRYKEGKVICKSDNNHHGEYPAIVLDVHDILEVWYVVETWSRQLSPPGQIYQRVIDLEADVALLKQKLLKDP